MRVFQNNVQPIQPFRKLKSRQSSIKKNLSTNQNTEYTIHSPHQFVKPETSIAQVSQFKLPNQMPTNYLQSSNSGLDFEKTQFQSQITTLQVNIESQIMQVFRQEFFSFKKSFSSIRKTKKQKPSSQSVTKQTKQQSYPSQPILTQQPQKINNSINSISKDISFSFINSNENLPISKSNGQIPFFSFRNCQNLQNLSAKPSLLQEQIRNFNQGNNSFDQKVYLQRKQTNSSQGNPFQTVNNVSESQKDSRLDYSQHRLRQGKNTINSSILQFSTDQKQFRRSHIKKNPSSCKCNQIDLSLISTQKSSIQKGKSPLKILHHQLSNDKKVLVTNKLIFLKEFD